jgi:hypothetical protein
LLYNDTTIHVSLSNLRADGENGKVSTRYLMFDCNVNIPGFTRGNISLTGDISAGGTLTYDQTTHTYSIAVGGD